MQIKCLSCSTEIEKNSSAHKYCKPCARLQYLKIKRECAANKLRKAGVTSLSSPVSCGMCGGEFVRQSANRKFCDECAPKKVALDKKAAREREKQANPEKARSRQRRYVAKNREAVTERLRRFRQTDAAREYWRSYHKQRAQSDPMFALNKRVRLAVWRCLKQQKAGRSWRDLIGYSVEDLAVHLERQFRPGMGWHNMGEWHIDHIVPVASFNFHSPDDADFKACWALTNLRPLWAEENHRKGAKAIYLL